MNFFRKPRAVSEPHKHVYDSVNGMDQFGPISVLKCSCGLGKVFSDSPIASVRECLKWRKA